MHRQDVKSNWNATQTFWWFPRVSEAMIGRQTYQVFALFQRRAYKACSNPTSAEALHQPPFARNCSHWFFSQFACGGYQEQSDSIHIPPMSLTTHYKFKTMLVKSSYPPPRKTETKIHQILLTPRTAAWPYFWDISTSTDCWPCPTLMRWSIVRI